MKINCTLIFKTALIMYVPDIVGFDRSHHILYSYPCTIGTAMYILWHNYTSWDNMWILNYFVYSYCILLGCVLQPLKLIAELSLTSHWLNFKICNMANRACLKGSLNNQAEFLNLCLNLNVFVMWHLFKVFVFPWEIKHERI